MHFSTTTEREALCGFLDQQRDALTRKARGVSEKEARQTPTASALSLLALIKHSAMWERCWFQVVVAGRTLPAGDLPDGETDFAVSDDDTLEDWLARYADAAAVSRQVVDARQLDDRCALIDENVRWVLLHVIEETARHAGHADIIRETLDGSQGM